MDENALKVIFSEFFFKKKNQPGCSQTIIHPYIFLSIFYLYL